MGTYEDEMQRMLAQEMQQRARREQTSDAIAGAKENYAGAYAIPPLTPEERQLGADADAAAAIPLGEAAYKQKDQFYGQGLLGMGVAGLLNLGKKKKIANRVAIAGEGLSRSRRATELANQRASEQAGIIAALKPVDDINAREDTQAFGDETALKAAAAAAAAATTANDRDQKNSDRDSNEAIRQDTIKQGMKSYLTRQEALSENIKNTYSSLSGMNDYITTAEDAAAMGGPEGKLAAPIIGIQQLFTSLGVDWGRSGLNSEILTSKSAKLVLDSIMEQEGGMKGVTEPELLVLADSLPNMSTSHEARIGIAKILRKVKKRQLRSDLLDYNQFSGDESWRGESHMPIRNYKEMMLSTYTQEEIEEAKARLMRGRQ